MTELRPVGMPLYWDVGRRLRVIRRSIANGHITRLLFALVGGELALLHGFVGRTGKMPQRERDVKDVLTKLCHCTQLETLSACGCARAVMLI